MASEDTGRDTGIVPIRGYDSPASLDSYLTHVCLDLTMGDVVRKRESDVNNVRSLTVASMIFNAVFEMDVELIKTIGLRIDGTVPEEGDRKRFANILGDAIDDVMDYDDARKMTIVPEDTPIIAMAKVLIAKATRLAGNNMQKRKERNLAVSMILERTGGRKVSPTKPMLETRYVEPDWMKLGGGEDEH